MTKKIPLAAKFGISVLWDFLDFTIFRIPVIGTAMDVISVPLAVALWGEIGILAAAEIVDVTDQLDATIPSLTIIGIMSTLSDRRKK